MREGGRVLDEAGGREGYWMRQEGGREGYWMRQEGGRGTG